MKIHNTLLKNQEAKIFFTKAAKQAIMETIKWINKRKNIDERRNKKPIRSIQLLSQEEKQSMFN